MTPGEQVRALYEAYQDRDWARAAMFLHPQVVVGIPATAERLEGQDAVIQIPALVSGTLGSYPTLEELGPRASMPGLGACPSAHPPLPPSPCWRPQ